MYIHVHQWIFGSIALCLHIFISLTCCFHVRSPNYTWWVSLSEHNSLAISISCCAENPIEATCMYTKCLYMYMSCAYTHTMYMYICHACHAFLSTICVKVCKGTYMYIHVHLHTHCACASHNSQLMYLYQQIGSLGSNTVQFNSFRRGTWTNDTTCTCIWYTTF